MLNVLIVDDEVNVLESIRKGISFDRVGIEGVYFAKNAIEAKAILKRVPIQIMITDIEMPQESGLELIKWTKTEHMNIVAILCTGYSDFNYAQKAIELQCFNYYLKPIMFSDLERILSAAVDKAKAEGLGMLPQGKTTAKQSTRTAVESMRAYLYEHYNEDVTREELARAVYLNPDYMSRLFRKKEGCSIIDYLIKIRVQRAAELLENTDIPIQDVSMEVGYDNFAYFSRLFKKEMGVSPREYRKRRREP